MKRIAFALCATFISVGTIAQGTLQKRLQGNPKIDSLVSEVAALGGNGTVNYYYDGKLHKTVSITCQLMNDFHPTPPTGNPQRDAQNQKTDSIRKELCEQRIRIYNAVRNTCKALTDDATESYTWEYHHNGVDSVRYTIALGEYQSGDTMTTWQRQREVQYYGAPEIITFRYDPLANNDGNPWVPKGFGYFRYEYTPDSVSKQMKELVPFNKEAYTALLQPILKQKDIATRQFYVYCDTSYTFKEVKWNDNDDFVLRENTLTPLQPKSETRGTVYTMHSKELADSVLSQLIQTTWAFLEDNLGISFHFNPHTYYGSRTMNELFENLDYRRQMGFYHIYLHSIGDQEFNVIVLEGTGDMMVPMEWLIVKSWKNGKVVYDKKRMKNMTPMEARSNTSNHRTTLTRQYEPID
jgi:hypothetical protein